MDVTCGLAFVWQYYRGLQCIDMCNEDNQNMKYVARTTVNIYLYAGSSNPRLYRLDRSPPNLPPATSLHAALFQALKDNSDVTKPPDISSAENIN